MKVTLKEQVVDDIKVIMEIADEILAEKKAEMSDESYYRFLAVILDHLHYCLDSYGFIEEKKESVQIT